METEPSNAFWQYDADHWFKVFNSSPKGLSKQSYLTQNSKNTSDTKPGSPIVKDIKMFLAQFKSPLMLLLIIAVIISGFLGDISDVIIILFIVLSSGLLSFFQERNAGKIVEKLQSMIALKSSVISDGQAQEVLSSDIIKGDVLSFNAGDMIPADCLLIESNDIFTNEASLTGESYPAQKITGVIPADTELAKRTNCLWEGTNIVSGTATAIVVQTGAESIFGNIVKSADTVVETTFEKGIKDFGYFLMRITLVLSVFILAVNLINHKSIIESALFALALAVGMAPELLPAITTIAMSAGAKRMLEQKVIVKKLASIQNLGEVDLLCTDKTGTITQGTIVVDSIVDINNTPSDYLKQLAYWNASFETGYANPIDEALRQVYTNSPILPEKIGEVPYDFNRKRLSIAIKTDTDNLLISKGAFTQISAICSSVRLSDGTIEEYSKHADTINQQYEKFGLSGLRTIAVSYKVIQNATIVVADEAEMIFGGFILLQDPIKTGIVDTIKALKTLSVNLKIITGDNINIAQSIGTQIGFENPKVIDGNELFKLDGDALISMVKAIDIFAEIEPQQKEQIIQALRKSFTVAYIGDGINDVSAINAADIGISVENAVDVAREAADFVLMEKDLMVLANGIKEGRKTFANTLKYIYISTGATFGNMCSVAAASLLLPFLPMLPKQILLTNFITDFPYLTVSSDNVDEEQLEKPGKWNIKLIRNYMVVFGIHSSFFDLLTFVSLYFVLKVNAASFQTSWFIESSISELLILFIIRTHKNFFTSKPGKYLFIFSAIGLIITIALPYIPFGRDAGLIPLPLNLMALIGAILLVYVATADILKVWFFKKYDIIK